MQHKFCIKRPCGICSETSIQEFDARCGYIQLCLLHGRQRDIKSIMDKILAKDTIIVLLMRNPVDWFYESQINRGYHQVRGMPLGRLHAR